jgi:hypothetical protein
MNNFRKFVILQFLATGLIEANLIVNNQLLPPNKIKSKGAKRAIEHFLNIKNNIKIDNRFNDKYEALMTRMELWKETKEWSPLLTGLDLSRGFLHPSKVDKTIRIVKAEDGFKFLDKHITNSLIIADKLRETL